MNFYIENINISGHEIRFKLNQIINNGETILSKQNYR